MTQIEIFDTLAREANEHDKDCDEDCCGPHRWEMVAMLMHHLGLDLTALGYIADAWLDYLDVYESPTKDSGPDILDEIGRASCRERVYVLV